MLDPTPAIPLEPPAPVRVEVDAMLAELARDGRSALDAVGRGSSPSVKPPKIRYSHEAMADMILQEPWISQNEIAARFGYSPSWVSTIITSDGFQSFLAARQAELVDPSLRLTLQERLRALTTQSLKVLQDKLSKPADQVSDNLALRTLELGSKALGLGQAAPPPPPADSQAHLATLAERLVRLQPRRDLQPIEDAVIVREDAA